MDPSSDSNSDFESQSQRLKEEEKKKNDQQDLSKMTLRQKQVYLQQISQQESNNNNLEGQTGLNSLESLGPNTPEIPRRVRKHKTITLEEQTENQRKALSKILEEMNRREKERDERQKQQKATRDK